MNRYSILILTLSTLAPPLHAQTTRPTTTKPAATQPAIVNKPVQIKLIQAQAVAAPAQVVVRAAPLQQAKAFANNIKLQRENMRQNIKNTPDAGTFKLEDLIRFSIVEGRLKCEWVGNNKIPLGQSRRIKIEGSTAGWLINRFNNGATSYFNVTCYDFDGPLDGFWLCQLSSQEGMNVTSIFAQGNENCPVTQLSFVQQPNMVTMSMYGFQLNQHRIMLNATAPDIFHLRSDHPEEVCRHLVPMLRKLTGQPLLRPGAGDVYRVFTAIPADPKITRQIEALLTALTSIDPIERDQASKSLRDLGPAGALAALRYDYDQLLPEQFNRLSALVAYNSRIIFDDPALSLKDPNFLIDCFEDEDLAVRQAAKTALETFLNNKVDFDPAAPLINRHAAAEAMQQKLAKIAAQHRLEEEFEIQ